MKPHKHAELIKAWADGATIQVLEDDGIWDDVQSPSWCERSQYRIKPEPKPDFYRYYDADTYGHVYLLQTSATPPNLRLTFDGETGELKSAEVLK